MRALALSATAVVMTASATGGASPGIDAEAAATPLAFLENRRVISYPLDQVWPTTIRYLRIDRGFEITDRDEDAGYILFNFSMGEQRRGSGSMEMFQTKDASGRPSVSMAVTTSAGPAHLPHAILEGVATKIRSERGQPAPPPAPPQAPPEPDDPNDDHSVPLLPPAVDP